MPRQFTRPGGAVGCCRPASHRVNKTTEGRRGVRTAVEEGSSEYPAVFVCRDGRQVPLEPWSGLTNWNSTDAAKTVAAARVVGGWRATQRFRARDVPLIHIGWDQMRSEP